MSLICFYSILVRLKVLGDLLKLTVDLGFYSILVRLKVSVSAYLCAYELFLFHTGSIKRTSVDDLDDLFNVSIPYWFD